MHHAWFDFTIFSVSDDGPQDNTYPCLWVSGGAAGESAAVFVNAHLFWLCAESIVTWGHDKFGASRLLVRVDTRPSDVDNAYADERLTDLRVHLVRSLEERTRRHSPNRENRSGSLSIGTCYVSRTDDGDFRVDLPSALLQTTNTRACQCTVKDPTVVPRTPWIEALESLFAALRELACPETVGPTLLDVTPVGTVAPIMVSAIGVAVVGIHTATDGGVVVNGDVYRSARRADVEKDITNLYAGCTVFGTSTGTLTLNNSILTDVAFGARTLTERGCILDFGTRKLTFSRSTDVPSGPSVALCPLARFEVFFEPVPETEASIRVSRFIAQLSTARPHSAVAPGFLSLLGHGTLRGPCPKVATVSVWVRLMSAGGAEWAHLTMDCVVKPRLAGAELVFGADMLLKYRVRLDFGTSTATFPPLQVTGSDPGITEQPSDTSDPVVPPEASTTPLIARAFLL